MGKLDGKVACITGGTRSIHHVERVASHVHDRRVVVGGPPNGHRAIYFLVSASR